MYRKTVSGILLTLLFIGMLSLAINIRPVIPEPKTWIVDDDGPADFHTIQEAINAANEGDTIYVKAGTYYENLVIKKSILLIGENKETTIIDGSPITPELDYILIFLKDVENVYISEFTLRNGPCGIELDHSNNCTITNNIIKMNYAGGITLFNSDFNILMDNTIISNEGDAIGVIWSNNNIIANNIIFNNTYGLRTQDAHNNKIYHNNFVNNKYSQAISTQGSVNVWDDGYPSGGNYWSDYKGTDLYGGPFQNITGSDGIGDTPYIINEYNVDRYPLMNPWTPAPSTPVINVTVDIHPNTLNLRSMGKWITAYIELPIGYNISDIDTSSIMLNSTIPVDLEAFTEIGDYDNDSIPDLMVMFNRTMLVDYMVSKGVIYGNLTLVLSGSLRDRWKTQFTGYFVMSVSALTGDVNCDGKVDIHDIIQAAVAYGLREGDPNWNANANFASPYDKIDIYDLVTLASHYGQKYP